MKKCYKCGHTVADDSEFCNKCGTVLDINKYSRKSSANKKKTLLIVAICAVVALIIAIFVAIIVTSGSSDTNDNTDDVPKIEEADDTKDTEEKKKDKDTTNKKKDTDKKETEEDKEDEETDETEESEDSEEEESSFNNIHSIGPGNNNSNEESGDMSKAQRTWTTTLDGEYIKLDIEKIADDRALTGKFITTDPESSNTEELNLSISPDSEGNYITNITFNGDAAELWFYFESEERICCTLVTNEGSRQFYLY